MRYCSFAKLSTGLRAHSVLHFSLPKQKPVPRQVSGDESARVSYICRIAFVARLDALDWNLIIRAPARSTDRNIRYVFDKHGRRANRNRPSKYYSGGGLKFPPLIQRARYTAPRGLGGLLCSGYPGQAPPTLHPATMLLIKSGP